MVCMCGRNGQSSHSSIFVEGICTIVHYKNMYVDTKSLDADIKGRKGHRV